MYAHMYAHMCKAAARTDAELHTHLSDSRGGGLIVSGCLPHHLPDHLPDYLPHWSEERKSSSMPCARRVVPAALCTPRANAI